MSKKNWRSLKNVQFFVETHTRCEACGKRGQFVPHHKWPKSYEESYPGESIHEDQNLACACEKCHSQTHDFLGQRPSLRTWHRETNARNLDRLIRKTGNPRFRALCPDYVTEAYDEFFGDKSENLSDF